MLNYMEQATYGVRGVITDTITGEPLRAQVFISGHDQDSSMVFSSLPVGNYHRPIKSGKYNITYFADGYMPKTIRNVAVSDKATIIVDVRLWNGTPIPAFTSSDTLIAPGKTIQFFDNSGGSPTSRLWTFEGGSPGTSTAQNPVIIYSQEGEFDVTLRVSNIIGSNTIVKEDYIEVQEGVGVKDQHTTGIRIYPNPVVLDWLNIDSPQILLHCKVTDLTGKQVIESTLNGTSSKLNLGSLQNGIYMIEIKDIKGTYSTKVMINR
jgi:PKD repeat protein